MRHTNARRAPSNTGSSESGLSLIWWAVFIAFVMVPLLVLSIEVARYFHARGEIQKGADLAALAAAQEVDVPYLRDTGQVRLTGNAHAVAQAYVASNTGYLTRHGIHARVTRIGVINSGGTPHVVVTTEADVSRLFPAVLGQIVVRVQGVAEARAF